MITQEDRDEIHKGEIFSITIPFDRVVKFLTWLSHLIFDSDKERLERDLQRWREKRGKRLSPK